MYKSLVTSLLLRKKRSAWGSPSITYVGPTSKSFFHLLVAPSSTMPLIYELDVFMGLGWRIEDPDYSRGLKNCVFNICACSCICAWVHMGRWEDNIRCRPSLSTLVEAGFLRSFSAAYARLADPWASVDPLPHLWSSHSMLGLQMYTTTSSFMCVLRIWTSVLLHAKYFIH